MRMHKKGQGEVVWPETNWWIIGLIVLVILLIAGSILIAKGVGAGEFIKNLFRFGN
jgi:hypothetical protein